MKALTFQSKDEPLRLSEVPKPVPHTNEVIVELKYAALNHLDLWIWKEPVLPQQTQNLPFARMCWFDSSPGHKNPDTIVSGLFIW